MTPCKKVHLRQMSQFSGVRIHNQTTEPSVLWFISGPGRFSSLDAASKEMSSLILNLVCAKNLVLNNIPSQPTNPKHW